MPSPSRVIPITANDFSQAGDARRQALSLAIATGFDELRQGQLNIVVTEAARNIAKHAGSGEIVLTPWSYEGKTGIDMLALDKGKGIENLSSAMQDGYSTAGTPGNGLGAIARLSGSYQIYSVPGNGTAVFARVLRTGQDTESETRPYRLGAISTPIPGESVCGDAWGAVHTPERSIYIVADGLGHGPLASEASEEAVRVFRQFAPQSPDRILNEIHGALTKTRGAAVSIAEVFPQRRILNYAGAGNIAGAVSFGGKTRSMVSMNGTVGHVIGKIQQFSYPWEPGSALIMHSDGLGTRWNVEQYPGLTSRHPALLAGVLFRDYCRKRDDATVLISGI
ncbi:anti-sigma regulatory factor (Ser/Thr protein kinase) [Silvibacterium bohemicum]|uniref:Anti-sigma regulatory factor (Ser/Thr protein kinase) n=1 Tax=Silvibacterium bohemicum TaxID=1577686 RepID=A0A841JQ11_9BACT|nr:ATP-binding SpoIIE family protein phosphatase [Silvibacterium bohemicum]MBB6143423.1 anti-sigma regulatory factor (Ser/Thr protein kinase) [Silvibacterium bohemicum]